MSVARYRPIASAAAEQLRQAIDRDFPPGTQLPNEKDLAVRLGVSRNTVREALAQLVLDGLVERRWGVGTIVREPGSQVSLSLLAIKPIRDVIADAGRTPRLAHAAAVPALPPSEVSRALRLGPEEKAWFVERLFCIDDTPAVLLRDYAPMVVRNRPIDLVPLCELNVTIVDLLAEQANITVDRMEGVLDAVAANGDLADLFRVQQGQPLVRVHQQSLLATGDVVIYTVAHYLAEQVRLSFART
ncbi:GntR family transcriptional regulator [Dactylosporangium sp. NPDC000244]|uniref:GntR family transcriptional regulator n=1 Tax=Dactylosporangium sp. NPDC000244 TaxID=3154365 RepID=UPI00332F3C2E